MLADEATAREVDVVALEPPQPALDATMTKAATAISNGRNARPRQFSARRTRAGAHWRSPSPPPIPPSVAVRSGAYAPPGGTPAQGKRAPPADNGRAAHEPRLR